MSFNITKPPPPPPTRDVWDCFGETRESKRRTQKYKKDLEEYGKKAAMSLRPDKTNLSEGFRTKTRLAVPTGRRRTGVRRVSGGGCVTQDSGERTALNLPRPLALQPEERELLTPREKRTRAEWAEQRYILPRDAYLAGPWSFDYSPFAREPLEKLSKIGKIQVTIRKCTQASGSEITNIFVGSTVEDDPQPTLIVMPTETDTNRRMNTRIKAMFRSSPSLAKHLPGGRVDNLNIGKETVLDNMNLYIGWAGSPAALADNSVCNVILDEVGKYPQASGKEADPVSLAKKRQRTFRTISKLLVLSTPVLTGDLVDREYNRGDRRRWWVKCPHCGQYHIIEWKTEGNYNVHLDMDADEELLTEDEYKEGGHAWYVCPLCEKKWSTEDRWEAVSAGKWAPEGCAIDKSGAIIGKVKSTNHYSYQINALMLYPLFVNLDELAAEWAAAHVAKKAGDISLLQDFINSQLGEPWEEREKTTDITRLVTHVSDYEAEEIPGAVQIITNGLDMQIDHVWLFTLGWGYLSELFTINTERIQTGDTTILSNLDIVADHLSRGWKRKDDSPVFVCKNAIDCGYRPEVAKNFCRKYPQLNIIPVHGSPTILSQVYNAKKEDDKLTRYPLNVDTLKDTLWRIMFESVQPGPGYFHLHREPSRELLNHLTSEEPAKVRKGPRKGKFRWKPKTRSGQAAANHLWDCLVYAYFAGYIAGATMLRDPDRPIVKRPPPKQTKEMSFLDRMPELRL